ncbi:hypothetical protein [Roseicyclus marinus]|uniref:hypothetical protein n=1 Tax=Roseicyclus marinus TaxID=2161673 RepID=UPI00240FCCD4|nr:hypothetical protein [Roseicyclus marinus]MDG3041546.1 hypothetical protein [Roseicyclus marinus]
MSRRKLLLRSSAIAALGGAGLAVVQYLDGTAAPVQADVASVVLTGDTVAPTTVTAVSGTRPPPDTPEATSPSPQYPPDVARSALGLPCGLTITAEATPGAMVALDVMEPCAPNARVEITHGALAFSARTDALGLLTLDIPAMETPAFFTVQIETGAEATTLAGLPDLIDHDRAAIVWTGSAAFQLHGYTGDAGFGEPGHLWRDNPGTVAQATIGTGGFLTVLGDPTLDAPRLAQVITIPAALRDTLSVVAEIAIEDATCGRWVDARSLQSVAGGPVAVNPVTLTLPGCDAVGEFLMLQNLFAGPRLVGN